MLFFAFGGSGWGHLSRDEDAAVPLELHIEAEHTRRRRLQLLTAPAVIDDGARREGLPRQLQLRAVARCVPAVDQRVEALAG